MNQKNHSPVTTKKENKDAFLKRRLSIGKEQSKSAMAKTYNSGYYKMAKNKNKI
jgi:hypothetical protein